MLWQQTSLILRVAEIRRAACVPGGPLRVALHSAPLPSPGRQGCFGIAASGAAAVCRRMTFGLQCGADGRRSGVILNGRSALRPMYHHSSCLSLTRNRWAALEWKLAESFPQQLKCVGVDMDGDAGSAEEHAAGMCVEMERRKLCALE